ncbi:nucleic acid-binding, OB-fold protein [Artemisia annua]|uniref:Nucleic acid-binding, OB-fold protein n=1 Tax=Artemisia annua TaxID=35608 RepID=A0A2U1L211_ARTAN|nr:nucleic acid-binding, OB-fold protein [Artemisia annua]
MGFKFVCISKIKSREIPQSDCVDVIGSVVSIGDSISYGTESQRRIITIEDIDGDRIECCFFGAMADLFDTFGANNEQAGHVVLILQLAKIKCWLGDTSLCPIMSGSKVYVNDDLPEVMSFRKRYQDRCSYKGSDFEVTSFNPPKTYVDLDKFLKGAKLMNVGDIRDTTNETTIVIYAKIHKIFKEFSWSYPVCKQCGRIAKENDSLHSWPCDRHGVMASIVERYKLVVRVIDDTCSTSLILSDNMFPRELDAIVGKKLLFRFFYSLYNMNTDDHVYLVKMISDDKCIIKKFKEYCDRVEKDEDSFEEELSMNNDDMRADHVSFKPLPISSFRYQKESNGGTNRGTGLKVRQRCEDQANENVKRPIGTSRKEGIDESVLYKSIENGINEDISLNQTNVVVEMPSTIAIDNFQCTNEEITENNELQDRNIKNVKRPRKEAQAKLTPIKQTEPRNPQFVTRLPAGRKFKNSKSASIDKSVLCESIENVINKDISLNQTNNVVGIDRSVIYKSIENVINEDVSLNQTNNVVEMPSSTAIDNLQCTNEGITEDNELHDRNDDMEFEYNDYVKGISKGI